MTLYHGDVLDVLSRIESGTIDAVVTDPPFQLLTRTFEAAENVAQVASIWPASMELARVCRAGAVAAVFYDSRALPMALSSFRYAKWVYLRHLTFYRRWGAAHQFHGWMSTSDFILVFSNAGAAPQFFGPWKHDVYVRDKREAETTGHPFQKPMDTVEHLVGNITPPLGTVIDPFAGAGTTLRAAKSLGRKAVGIEIEERYCEIAALRMSQEVLDFGDVA